MLLLGRITPVPYFIVGGDAFPLKTISAQIIPVQKGHLEPENPEEMERRQRIFDYRSSRAHRAVENAEMFLMRKLVKVVPHVVWQKLLSCETASFS